MHLHKNVIRGTLHFIIGFLAMTKGTLYKLHGNYHVLTRGEQ